MQSNEPMHCQGCNYYKRATASDFTEYGEKRCTHYLAKKTAGNTCPLWRDKVIKPSSITDDQKSE